jgi:ankyrin repeat protein
MIESDPGLIRAADKRTRRTGLHRAVENGHKQLVEFLLAKGADVNARAPELFGSKGGESFDRDSKPGRGETPLHLAAALENPEFARLLVDRGAEVNAKDDDGHTPLHVAVRAGREPTVRLLFEHGADPNVSEKNVSSPLSLSDDRLDIAGLILAQKLRPEVINDALAGAVFRENKDFAHLLLKHGAEPNINAACILGLKERVSTLVDANPSIVNAPTENYYKRRLINLAAEHGQLSIVELLVAKGAEIQPKEDRWPISEAAENGRLSVVQFLVEQGTDINEKGKWGDPPLIAAASGGHANVVRFLLDRGAKPLATEESRKTALHAAARKGATEVAEIMLDVGVPVNSRDRSGQTPLHVAAYDGHAATAELLLRRGANINARDRRGQTPLAIAEQDVGRHYFGDPPDRTAVADLLRNKGGTK